MSCLGVLYHSSPGSSPRGHWAQGTKSGSRQSSWSLQLPRGWLTCLSGSMPWTPCPLQGQWTMTQAAPIPSPRALPKGLTRGFGGLWEKARPGHHPQKGSGQPSLQEACLALRLGPHPQLMAQPRPQMPMTMVTPAHPLCTETLLGAWLSRHPALLRPQLRASVQGRGPTGLSGYTTHRLAGGVRPHHQHRGHRATESPSQGGDPSLAPEAGSTCLVGLSASSPDVAGSATTPEAIAPSIAQYPVGPERLTWLSPSPTSPTRRSGTARHSACGTTQGLA